MSTIHELLLDARRGGRALALEPTERRNEALTQLALALRSARDTVLAANARDVARAREAGLSAPMLDRLTLDAGRYESMVRAVEEVRALPDPLGEEVKLGKRPSGIELARRRVPLGTLAVIYEARPNVTVEAAALALKSGNAMVLRGGKEALESNVALLAALRTGLARAGLDGACVQLVTDTARERVGELLGATGYVDLVIPRGGAELMKLVDQYARVPVLRHGQGICHVYVDESAEREMAVKIVVNAKAQRPGVCNAAETLLVHRAALGDGRLLALGQALVAAGVELRADERAAAVFTEHGVPSRPAEAGDWDTEFMALVLAVRVVDGLDEALAHIAEHGTHHTAAIVSEQRASAERFLREVDASCVLWNASTRFNDGGELGLGAELGVSTSKMHAYGPMGLREMTAQKFVVYGTGQVRG